MKVTPLRSPEYAQFGGPFRDSPEWGSNSVIMPWYMYEWYGDKRVLEDAYPMMQRYIAYLKYKSGDSLLKYGLGDWYGEGSNRKTAAEGTSNGTGFVKNFAPVRGQRLRLVIENKTSEPLLLEWQLYGRKNGYIAGPQEQS